MEISACLTSISAPYQGIRYRCQLRSRVQCRITPGRSGRPTRVMPSLPDRTARGGGVTVLSFGARRWSTRSLLSLVTSPLAPETTLPGRAEETFIASPQGKPIVPAIVPSVAPNTPFPDTRARAGYCQGYRPRLVRFNRAIQLCDSIAIEIATCERQLSCRSIHNAIYLLFSPTHQPRGGGESFGFYQKGREPI